MGPKGHRTSAQKKRYRSIIIGVMELIILFKGLTFLIFQSSFCTNNPLIALYGLEGTYSNDCEWGPGSKFTLYSMAGWCSATVYLIDPLGNE
jgi:hypothetical protein